MTNLEATKLVLLVVPDPGGASQIVHRGSLIGTLHVIIYINICVCRGDIYTMISS